MELEGRAILVTGASAGIGAAVAERCRSLGARVACLSRRGTVPEGLQLDSGVIGVSADVGDRASAIEGVRAAADALGHLDGVVNNAGAMLNSRLEEGLFDDWRTSVDVNILGPMYVSYAAVPYLKTRRSSDIINMVSTSAFRVLKPEYAMYGATKAALLTMTKGMRQELHEYGIRVSAIAPGLVGHTELGPGVRDPALREELLEMATKGGISPADVAAEICHMLSRPPSVRIDQLVVVPLWQVQ